MNGVFWTIGIEIQFYLIAPVLCLLFTTLSKKVSLLIGFLFYAALVGLQYLLVIKYGWNYDGRNIVSNLPHFFIGMIGCALVYEMKPSFLRLIICIGAALILLGVSNYIYQQYPTTFWSTDGIFLIDALILIIIIAHGSIKSVPNSNKVYLSFSFLGVLSYGIYAWHPLLMRFFDNIPEKPFYVTVIILSLTIIISFISYILIEKTFLKLKRY